MVIRRILPSVLFVFATLNSCCNCESEPESDFKSIIRLWSSHHTDDSLNADLMAAIDKYPDACDEVWFLFDGIDESPEYTANSLSKLKAATQKMRDRGIIVSLQVVAIGHPEGDYTKPSDPNSLKVNKLGFRPMISHNGCPATTQTCPRDTAFANAHARNYALYAEAARPYAIYIDDDLRLTRHNPAPFICFCDECLKQFSKRTGKNWTREALSSALDRNEPSLRREWIKFSQEGLAVYARIVSEAVHRVSPQTRMGLQHVGFHEELLEGWDWNCIFNAMKEATGLNPVSRPGHGYYNDRAPREMLDKGYGISRQIHRLPDGITEISPEIEGYIHKATGKSPQSICTETMLYLGLGATGQSYAIICAAQEPMEWYADNYFKYLQKYHPLFSSFRAYNRESHPCGIDSYISPNQVYRDTEAPFEWICSTHGREIIQLAPYGVTLTPESPWCTATTLDAEAAKGMTAQETDSLLDAIGTVMTKGAWNILESKGFTSGLKPVKGGYLSPSGKRVAVVENFDAEITGAQRNTFLDILDWVSDDKMYVKFETMVQATVVPRSDDDGTLHSIVYVNTCISDQENITLRLRRCPTDAEFIWHSAGNKDHKLKSVKDGEDYLVTIPFIKAWDAAWMGIESCHKCSFRKKRIAAR